jgi:serine/threonine-protein kinase
VPSDRWQRIEQLYHETLERPPREREQWLAEVCGSDEGLRREVSALLRYDDAEPEFLGQPALLIAARALAHDETTLVGRRLGGYEVLELIGAGGMGRIYRARDVRLGRDVALKILEPVASSEHAARVEAEARAASILNHPNIVTIYGVGEDGDTAYIAMELVGGRSLRALLSEARLPMIRALDIAVQLADAMAAAHACGIIHRDLKPENVMVTPDGRIKVLDFGIATLAHERPATTGPAALARPGTITGTLGYMSPEQAQGRPATPASDQFSFGVICSDMLGDGPQPAPLTAILARCVASEPDRRYADTAQLLADLRRVKNELDRVDGPAPMGRRQLVVLGGVAALGALSGAAAWRWWPRGPALRSLAVLPFANPAGDAGTESLCDGITETLIRQLATVPGLTVIARATAFTFKGREVDPRAAGARLGVEAVLTGTVTRRAGRVLLSAELVESATGARLWGADLDRPAADVLAVQNELAQAILTSGARLVLSGEQRRRLSHTLTDDPAAYELFLRAVHHLRLATEGDYLAARDLLERAVDRAPRFTLALVTLASTYSVVAVDGYAAPADAWPESERLVARALAIDPDLADAHAEAAAAAFFYRWDWHEAERHRTSALRLRNELQSELLDAFALQEWALGESQAALDLARAARQVDPLSAHAAVREADLLVAVGRLDDAVSAYERVIRDVPDDLRAYFGLAEVRRVQGRFDEALALRRRAHAAARDTWLDPLFARARGASGYAEVVHESARWELQRLAGRKAAGGYVSPLDFARTHALLGEAGAALDFLAAALDERAAGLALLNVDPSWNTIRRHPRFQAAVRRVGLACGGAC